MSAHDEMVERVTKGRVERDRLIAEAEAKIKDAHVRFASLLGIETARADLDEESGKMVRQNKGEEIAEAAGFKTRTYLYGYIKRNQT